MNALSPSYTDTYKVASAPDGWVSRAELEAETLNSGVEALNKTFEALQDALAECDAAIADLAQIAESHRATRDDIDDQAALLRRMERARRALQGDDE